MSTYVTWFEDCEARSVPLVGGKCSSLGELLRAEVEVPGGFAVTTEAHRRFMADSKIAHTAAKIGHSANLEDAGSVSRATAEVRELFQQARLDPAIEDAVASAYETLAERCGHPEPPVAVRSSATGEDHHSASFAGQLETYLWIEGAEAVIAHMLRCWSALFEPHMIAYCEQVGVSYEDMVMSVGVQHIIDARASGVLFTVNPINGDRSKVVLESCWGLGEGVVTGEIDADRFTVDKVTFDVIERHCGAKREAYRFVPERRRVERVPVPDEQARRSSLDDDDVAHLVRLGKRIERHYGRAMDVEWAVGTLACTSTDERYFILQARPETVASRQAASGVAKVRGGGALDHVVAGMVARGGRGGGRVSL
ncbi:MAG: PEP/pyruvate-binding domain-containing protein [Acidimicrobiia bacterium]|nr:PEP/pyruvate-binding domain-containing protein [Acidimicrobiia bacterium]